MSKESNEVIFELKGKNENVAISNKAGKEEVQVILNSVLEQATEKNEQNIESNRPRLPSNFLDKEEQEMIKQEMKRVIDAHNENENGSDSREMKSNTSDNNINSSQDEEERCKFEMMKKFLPDEHDRKRIVGCFAAILAFQFSYDVNNDEELINNDYNNDQHAFNNDASNPFEFHHSSSSASDFSTPPSTGSNRKQMVNSSSTSSLQDNDYLPTPSTSSSSPVLPPNSSQKVNQNTMSWKDNIPFTKRRPDKEKTALIRHRKRRYEFYLSLLQTCAELLYLDKAHALAFAPMLSRLLNPPPPPPPSQSSAAATTSTLKKSPSTISTKTQQDQDLNSKDNSQDDNPQTISLLDTSDDTQDSNSLASPTTINNDNDYSIEPNSPNSTSTPAATNQQIKQIIENSVFLSNDKILIDLIEPFLENLSPRSGYRCISLLLLHHLVTCPEGYDARVRTVFKQLAVLILSYEMRDTHLSYKLTELSELATRKFEATENAIAEKLLSLPPPPTKRNLNKQLHTHDAHSKQKSSSKRNIVLYNNDEKSNTTKNVIRGLQIGGAGVLAGTLFAFTGGLAAPAIAAGLATLAGTTAAATTAFATFTSTMAITAIFGVGGGGLAAFKMQRRVKGLTEFDFQKESRGRSYSDNNKEQQKQKNRGNVAELHSIICISGWLRDSQDYQRPWGVKPTKPPITSILENLERFYFVYRPENVARCQKIMTQWKGQERELWKILKMKYGRDPDHLFPLRGGPRDNARLDEKEDSVLDDFFEGLGFDVTKNTTTAASTSEGKKDHVKDEEEEKIDLSSIRRGSTGSGMKDRLLHRIQQQKQHSQQTFDVTKSMLVSALSSSHIKVVDNKENNDKTPASCENTPTKNEENSTSAPVATSPQEQQEQTSDNPLPSPPSHLLTVYDFQSQYSGELYTVKWESDLLLELCDSVTDLAVDLVGAGTREILRHTAVATLITAIAIPAAMVNSMNMIDETWGLAIKRAEEAGVELANCLLENQAGHRPITLVGFSMGARIIYTCLKELAIHQEAWEEMRNQTEESKPDKKYDKNKRTYSREPASIIEDVVLMGLPNHLSVSSWYACRRVVAGRLVNCYSKKDFILNIMFNFKRMTGILKPVCGTAVVPVRGVENYDVTAYINAHTDYCLAVHDILEQIKFGQPRLATNMDLIAAGDDIEDEEVRKEVEDEEEDYPDGEGVVDEEKIIQEIFGTEEQEDGSHEVTSTYSF